MALTNEEIQRQLNEMGARMPTIQQGIRILQQQGGDQPAILSNRSDIAQNTSQVAQDASSPYQKFMQQIGIMLQQAQQGIIPQQYNLQRQALDLQQQQVQAGMQTPQELIGAPPSLQAGVRQAQAQAFEPTIQGLQNTSKGLGEKLTQFENILKYAKDFGAAYAKISPTPEILNSYKEGLKIGKLKVSDIPDEVRSNVISKMTKEDWAATESGTSKLLSVSDAVSLGVPYGTTEQQAADIVKSKPQQIILNQTGQPNEQYLATIPQTERNIVQNIANYKVQLPTGFALRSPYWQRILEEVSNYDPTFDATQYVSRQRLRTDFVAGKGAQNIRSLNTVVGHLQTLKEKADNLQNQGFLLWNKIKNYGFTQTGDKRVVEFQNAATAVENELASVFKGTGATDQEIKQWRANLNSVQSPEQLNGSIDTAVELMSSRIQALQQQWESGIGKPADFKFLSNKSKEILTNMGYDVNQIDPIISAGRTTKGNREFEVIP